MTKQKGKITFIHSLNNYSGSPNVLSIVIKGFLKRGYQAGLITSKGEGFLSNIPDLQYEYSSYKWLNSKIATLLLLIYAQTELFFRIIFSSNKTLFYINTITPFAAILACRLIGCKFVIHVHENMGQKKPLYFIYRSIYKLCNKNSIFVSKYLKSTAVNCRKGEVIYNALPQTYVNVAINFLTTQKKENQTILMVASLRRFKGIYEFAKLAKLMPLHRFELVLSATPTEAESFLKEIGEVKNLMVYPSQSNLHPFYQRAKLLLQLSHPESWVETFGLTILEAMVYGVPAIVPNVGGPTELIEDNYNGFTVNPHCLAEITQKINRLMEDTELYRLFSERALCKSKEFNEEDMIIKIEKYIQ